MKKSTLFLLLFGLGFVFQATAQNKTVVYGNLGAENVNISISNTAHGTTNDDGTVTFSNLKMKMTGHVGYITVEVSKSGYGEDSSCRITVIA